MATEPQQVLMVEGSLDDAGPVLVSESQVQACKDDQVETEVSADILQQALQEATEQFEEQTNVEYDDVENAVAVVHGIEPPPPEEEEENGDVHGGQVETLDLVEEGETQDNDADYTNDSVTSTSEVTSGSVRILTSLPRRAEGSNPQAPIGSSANPIQIIQQGNTYHSTQVLSQEQLQQIAQVLQQQQQLSQATTPNGSTSVLYNAATNTRIVYRIIYPSELHSKGPATSPADAASKSVGAGRGRGRPRKPWGKRFEDLEEKVEVPELSREEKEEKKKHRPRTRSGRISKPPKYMVKDYKRIHHLDFDDEPYDDSDGGYSDYRLSGEDDDNSRSSSSSILMHGATGKPRKYKCRTCNKAYIGKGGLARHYRLNSGHGNADELEAEVSASNNASLDGLPGSGPATPASINESQASNDGSMFATQAPVPTPAFAPRIGASTPGMVVKRGRGRPSNHELASVRRKAKLKELVKQCENEELMETVLPRLAEVVSVWEFLLMKCEQGTPACPFVPDICKEIEDLLKQAQKMAQEFLNFIPEEARSEKTYEENDFIVQVSSEPLAHALGLPVGMYEAKEMHQEKAPMFQYKMLTTDPTEVLRNQTARRTVEIVAPDDLVESPRKRMRMDDGNQSVDDTPATMENSIADPVLNTGPEESLDFSNLNRTLSSAPDNDDSSRNDETSAKQQLSETLPPCELGAEHDDAGSQPNVDSRNQAAEFEADAASNDGATMLNVAEMDTENIGSASEGPVELSGPNHSEMQMEGDEIKEEQECLVEGEAGEGATQVCGEADHSTVIATDDKTNRIISLAGEGQQFITQDGQIITMQDGSGQAILGQVICQGSDGDVIRQVMIQDGQIVGGTHIEGLTDLTEVTAHNLVPSNVLIVQNADGSTTTLQLPSDQNIPLETVQALLAMDAESQAQLLTTPSTQIGDE